MSDKRLRILHICETSGTGGAETVLLNIVNRLGADKYLSTVVLFRDGWLRRKLAENDVTTVILNSSRSYNLSLLYRIWRTIRKLGIHLVHSQLPDANAYSCLAGFAARVPIVTTYHGKLAVSPHGISSDSFKLSLVKRFSTKTVTVSKYLKNDLTSKAGFPSSKVQVIYNGVDWERFDRSIDRAAKRRELGFGPHEKLVGMVANLRETKGYEYFVRAAKIISEKIPKSRFLIVGDGPATLKEMIKEEIKALGLTDWVTLLGFREDIPEILGILDLFILSSTSEGLSIATIEAMGAGLPVVVTACGGPQEIVENGKTGFLVPPRDAESLAEKALLSLSNRELADSMGRKAQIHARASFGIESMIRKYETVYRECLPEGER